MPVRITPRIAAALALTHLAVPAGAWDVDCRHSADREIRVETAGASRIEIAARAGDLDVRAGTAGQVLARGRACASSAEFLEQTQLRAVRDGSTLKVFVQVPEEMKGIGLFYARLDVEIDVPADVPVEVIDSSGDATVTGVRLTRLTDSSGDVDIARVAGSVPIENDSSGDIDVTDVGRDVAVLADTSGTVSVPH
jgi:hypothetical protein